MLKVINQKIRWNFTPRRDLLVRGLVYSVKQTWVAQVKREISDGEGQSLFEVIFAIAVAAIILVGIVSIGSSSVRNSSFSRNQSLATRHVSEASEWLRSQRDASWTTFVSWASISSGTLWCLGAISSGLTAPAPTCNQIPGTTFTREVTLVEEAPDIVRAEISVTWTDSQGAHVARSIARFTDWR